MTGDGSVELVSWTSRGSDDAFLVLDRNANGVIDNATELFSHIAPQAPSPNPNGFEALRVLDINGDGQVNAADPDFGALRLWTDRNHNGRSEPNELKTLAEPEITSLSVDYRESRRRDAHGNLFRYRARLESQRSGRWMFDVYLVVAPPETTNP